MRQSTPPGTAEGPLRPGTDKPFGIRLRPDSVLLIGALVLLLLCVVPIWTATILLADPIYMYFLNDAVPGSIIVFCMAVLLFYIFTMVATFSFGKRTLRDKAAITCAFLALLGAGFLVISRPASATGSSFRDRVFTGCDTGRQFLALTDAYRELHRLRSSPECAAKASVVRCPGFSWSPEAGILQQMEGQLRCSGWCTTVVGPLPPVPIGPAPARAANGTNASRASDTEVASLVQRGAVVTHRRGQKAPPETTDPYPPTLFSLSNYQASCNGMAARSIDNYLQDLASELFYVGLALLCVFIVVSFASILINSQQGQSQKPPPVTGAAEGGTSYATFVRSVSEPR